MEFRVLGAVEVQHEDRVEVLSGRLQRTLLGVLLARANQPVPVDVLTDALWGDRPDPRVAQKLQLHVHRLRGVLNTPDRLSFDATGYQLRAQQEEIDAERFEALVKAGAAASEQDPQRAIESLRAALTLWRGNPFPDLEVPVLADWARRLAEGRLNAVESLYEAELACGLHEAVIGELVDLVREHPLRERLHGLLMTALYWAGRRSEALEAYHRARHALVSELGLEPGPELRELQRRILADDLPAPALDRRGADQEVPAQLPVDVRGFVGRETELAELDGLLSAEAPVVITAVAGTAGVGKTALALHWAHRVRDRFPDGQLYVNLRGFDPGGQAMPPGEALRTLLELLGVALPQIPATAEAQAGLYRSRLAKAKMLVLLDNARDAEQIRPLLPGSAGSMALVTSRSDLASLVATEGARLILLNAFDADQARLLLTRRLGPDRMDAEPEAVDAIIATCAGLPLALAIVAARVATRPVLPLSAFAAELADEGYLLDALSGSDAATDIRAVLSWSYHALDAPTARLFLLLGLHPGPDISLHAAASLVGLPLSQARRLLTNLAGAHLITEHTPARYTLHDLIRAYAAELACTADQEPDQQAATNRLLDHYVGTSHRAAKLINPRPTPVELDPAHPGAIISEMASSTDAIAWFDAERQVLLACVDRAADMGHDVHSWQLAWAIGDYLERRGRWADVLASQHTALTAARRHGDRIMEAVAHQGLGLNYSRVGQHHLAGTHLREAIRLNASLGWHRGVMTAHLAAAILCDKQSRHEEAIDHNLLALAAAEAAGDLNGQVGCLGSIGWQLAQLGRYHEGIAYCERALAIPVEHNHRYHADTWDSLGHAHHQLEQHEQAAMWFERAATSYRRLDVRLGEAESLTRLSASRGALGDEPAAREALLDALAILEDLDHPDAERVRKQLE